MKILSFTILFLLASLRAHTCGWGPEGDNYFFYNIFYQTNISSKAYFPFLRDNFNAFFQPGDQPYDSNAGNLQLWGELLPRWTTDEISKALYSRSNDDFEKSWNGKKSAIELSAKRYMEFARKCSQAFEYRNQNSWAYSDIIKNETPDAEPLLTEGMQLFMDEKSPALKLRYGYQVIRILHYSKQYQGAIDFYQDHINSKFEPDEMYYYALDQVAGCYYSLANFDYAAYLYIRVFCQSADRKKSAFVSYKFCTNYDAEGKPFFKNLNDTVGYTVIKSLRTFSDDLAGVKELIEEAPSDQKTELLFMRALNNLERRIWPTHIGMGEKILPNLQAEDVQRIQDLEAIASSAYAHPKIMNKDFWLLAGSYLAFLRKDQAAAMQQLIKVRNPSFKDQKEILAHLYEVFSWKQIEAEDEQYLVPLLDQVINDTAVNVWGPALPGWKYLIMDQVAHVYYANDKLAKAFLIHNRLEAINDISSLPLLDDLLSFVKQEHKNDFEKILMRRTAHLAYDTSPKDYLEFVKGLYYLQKGDPQNAYSLLNHGMLNQVMKSDDYFLDDYVSAKIFSNNITECFSCPDTLMVDSVYLSSLFSFINPNFSKGELAGYLLQLDSLTRNKTAWKSKLAHYLLANYYFNVSNTGYYRGTLTGESNCCSYHYFFDEYDHHTDASYLIDHHAGFNLFDIGDHSQSYHALASKAYDHYQAVLDNSRDKELNARCLYMMAKCELNAYYNETGYDRFIGYDGTVDARTRPYKKSFEQLRKDYEKTRFYEMIIRECSFFRYYCSL